jgi:hypothetical protein
MIPTGNKLTPSQLEFSQVHESTFYKIRFADYHLSTLEQIYHPHMEKYCANIVFNSVTDKNSMGLLIRDKLQLWGYDKR